MWFWIVGFDTPDPFNFHLKAKAINTKMSTESSIKHNQKKLKIQETKKHLKWILIPYSKVEKLGITIPFCIRYQAQESSIWRLEMGQKKNGIKKLESTEKKKWKMDVCNF